MHGGFENETPNVPTNTIMKMDMAQLLANSPPLLQKLEQGIGPAGKDRKSNTASTDSTARPDSSNSSQSAM